MNADTERALLDRAHQLADTDDLAEEVTDILGRARGARLDPDALTNMAGAALMLGADSITVYRATGPAYADDQEYADAIEDADCEISLRAGQLYRTRHEAEEARDAAYDALATGRQELARAKAMGVHRPCDGCHGARATAIATAEGAIADARERTRYADEARSAAGYHAERVVTALARIHKALPDLGEVYESVYGHVDAGRLLPKDGDWLTGQESA